VESREEAIREYQLSFPFDWEILAENVMKADESRNHALSKAWKARKMNINSQASHVAHTYFSIRRDTAIFSYYQQKLFEDPVEIYGYLPGSGLEKLRRIILPEERVSYGLYVEPNLERFMASFKGEIVLLRQPRPWFYATLSLELRYGESISMIEGNDMPCPAEEPCNIFPYV